MSIYHNKLLVNYHQSVAGNIALIPVLNYQLMGHLHEPKFYGDLFTWNGLLWQTIVQSSPSRQMLHTICSHHLYETTWYNTKLDIWCFPAEYIYFLENYCHSHKSLQWIWYHLVELVYEYSAPIVHYPPLISPQKYKNVFEMLFIEVN